jgi:hypothetical protein
MKYLVTLIMAILSLNSFSVERPDLNIGVKLNFICKDGKSLSGRKYRSFCKRNSNTDDYELFVLFDLNEDVLLHSQLMNQKHMSLGNLQNWCSKEIIDPVTGTARTANPYCVLEVAEKGSGNTGLISIPSLKGDSNFINVNISALDSTKTYYAHLKEISSGVRSKQFIIKF